MKRDMDLIRKILIEIENSQVYPIKENIEIEGYKEDVIIFHIILLKEAGLIEADFIKNSDGSTIAEVSRLTWEGYEFLDSTRNSNIWNKAKSIALNKTSGLTFTILKELLITLAREAVLNQ